MSIMPSK